MNAFLIFALVLTFAYIIYYGFAIAQDIIMAQHKEAPDSEVIDAPDNKDSKDSGIKSFDVEETPEGGFRVDTEPNTKPEEEKPIAPQPVATASETEPRNSPASDPTPTTKVIHETFEREKTQAEKSVETTTKELSSITARPTSMELASDEFMNSLEQTAKDNQAGNISELAEPQTEENNPNGKGIDRI